MLTFARSRFCCYTLPKFNGKETLTSEGNRMLIVFDGTYPQVSNRHTIPFSRLRQRGFRLVYRISTRRSSSASSSFIPFSAVRGRSQFPSRLLNYAPPCSSVARFSHPVPFYSRIPDVSFHAVLPSQARSSSYPPAFLSTCICFLCRAIF